MEELHLENLLERKRELKPKVKPRAPLTTQISSCELLVQVVGAKNIPLRSEADFQLAEVNTAKPLGSTPGEAGGGAASAATDSTISSGRKLDPTASINEFMLDEMKLKERRRANTFVEVLSYMYCCAFAVVLLAPID
jgi:hypothetical protein